MKRWDFGLQLDPRFEFFFAHLFLSASSNGEVQPSLKPWAYMCRPRGPADAGLLSKEARETSSRCWPPQSPTWQPAGLPVAGIGNELVPFDSFVRTGTDRQTGRSFELDLRKNSVARCLCRESVCFLKGPRKGHLFPDCHADLAEAVVAVRQSALTGKVQLP